MKIDLHAHSTHSDGSLSPLALATLAIEANLDMFALTDHDQISGIKELASALQSTSIKPSIRLIPGAELTSSWRHIEIHILALAINLDCPALNQHLHQQIQRRRQRLEKYVEQIIDHAGLSHAQIGGLNNCLASHWHCPTRTHLAAALVESGICTNKRAAFQRFLKTSPNSVSWPDLAETISIIHQAGGHAILAHPFHYGLKTKAIRNLINHFHADGGDGIEFSIPVLHHPPRRQLLAQYCQQYDLCASVGSDFHQPNRPLGWTVNQSLPNPIWQRLAAVENAL